jgi:hypothetical protein
MRFDTDHNNSISFEEFQTQMLKMVGKAPQMDDETSQRLAKMLTDL